ncbi:hypothetical protein [Gottfriedia solisilvae]|uniref:Uncharacterized protein n=1 Tax=Gottfriedia solisilvae TaxID=1516104 RepID=A0A8J3AEM1_9BACI|nr:hypothetical protein [Gottfriedia solisilvae]GGI12913.1 hypothetical protein GCM10007380_15290 [Gottfriedia solisilvae]
MKFSLFIEAKNLEETKKFLDDFHKFADTQGCSFSVINIEKYWKIDEMYSVSLEAEEFTQTNLKTMLNHIASKWEEYPDELLASKTMDDCEIYISNLYMIVVYF